MICEKEHRYDPQYNDLPVEQGGEGRHRCAGCAYKRGNRKAYKLTSLIYISTGNYKFCGYIICGLNIQLISFCLNFFSHFTPSINAYFSHADNN